MKKTFYLLIALLAMSSCKKENNFVTFSGKITNPNSKTITIFNKEHGFKKVINVDENGVFKDTFNIAGKAGLFSAFDGREYARLFLENGSEINMTLDTKKFDESIKFSGKGSGESNYLAKISLMQENFFDPNFVALPQEEFKAKVTSFTEELNTLLSDKELNPNFVKEQKEEINQIKDYMTKMYEDNLYIKNTLSKGKPSPKFTNYENAKGGETSLDDLKGKYIYIDLWATWCQPCKQEIPFLKKVEEQFKGKNIEFVSVSVDRAQDKELWSKMVKDMNLTGTQLFAKGDKTFMDAYKISGIPRFILLDAEGNIISANAPRPSNPELLELLNSLEL